MGFDELNILSNPDSDSDGAGVGAGAGGALGGMKPLEYDFLENLDTSKVDTIKEKMKTILGYIPLIAAGLGAWKITRFITDLVFANTKAKTLKEAIALLGKKLTLTAGATLAVTGIVLETKGIISAFKEGLNGVNFAEILGGGGMIVAGGALIGKFFGSSLLGAAIGAIVAGIPMFVTGIYDAIMNGLNWLNGILIPAGATLTGAGIGAIIGMLGGPIGAGIGALIGLAVGLVTDLVILIVQNWESITAWCSQACKDIGQFFVDLWNGIVSVWNTVAEWFNTKVIQPVVNFFVGLWEGISTAASNCWNAIVTFFTPAIEWFSALFSSIFQTISDIFYNIGVIARGCWEIIKAIWGIVGEWFNTWIITPVANFFSGLWNGIKNTAIGAWEGIKSVFSTIGNWMNVKIIQPVSKFFSGMWDGFKEGAKKAWEGVKSVFSSVATWFGKVFSDAWKGIVKIFSVAGDIFVDIKDGIVSAFKWIVNGLIKGRNAVISVPFKGINTALNWIKNIEIVGLQPFADLKTINIPQIPLLAGGGIVNAGQMFIAREAGPELVGSIGRKTAVANNDQIISGIESGVYRAMMAANSTNKGGSQTIRIINEIDGDVVGEKVIQYHNGKVMQTGASPLLV
jgi:phage-related protein